MDQQAALERFRQLPPVQPRELIGLWRGRGLPTGHPLDGVLENLGWFGKRFTPDMKADALLFDGGERRLLAIDPAWVPLRMALRFSSFGRTQAARNLFSYIGRRLRAQGPVATVKTVTYEGVSSAAMVYDSKPITDHFRRIDETRILGMMVIEGDARPYFFELEQVVDPAAATAGTAS
ncbi:protein of unknown function [Rhizobium sp. RU36D]|nr:protein of unknown function [Rhizobium sp. RU36D]